MRQEGDRESTFPLILFTSRKIRCLDNCAVLAVDLGGMEQQFFVSHSLRLLISSRFLPESTQLTRLTDLTAR